MTGIGATNASATDPIIASKSLLSDPRSADGSYISKATYKDDRSIRLYVYSAAMDQTFPVDVQRPADASVPRPTLYLLNGAGGGEDDASWQKRTDIVNGFLTDKDVNVVQPIGGKWSYYTDWIADDPVLGRNKWKTFFTEELPPLIDSSLGTNGINAIAGLSTSGTAVLNLPIAKPGLYKAAAAYSGCAQTADPVGQTYVKLAVQTWGGGDTLNMYGPDNSPEWAANDPFIHADELRDLDLYLSTGNGLPGVYDTLDGQYALAGSYGLANQILVGGIIESAVNQCTHNMKNRLDSLGIPATYNFRNSGTHSWGYWKDDFKDSWPVLAHGMGLEQD
ncbi:alpha/beta hydrolase [Nocardia aurantia]|uniref:Diacylglycerol acyltransferase/mycolyltransferase Ag85B n=1 Tax=Nocardia aurantia TaxID=2585199 RepID=A0A7K0DGE3_9NOCA|nr:alpha/beta hydrolase family protein [Nocardia aurantia]MQY24883.1 Diacylglycerol acyltransferase/mycolyltransferase Ag85B [Nocardia aurantia]